MINFLLIFFDTVSLDGFFPVSIGSTIWIHEKEVVQPSRKPRNVGPHGSKLKKTTSKKKEKPEEQEIQECNNPDTKEVKECGDTNA